MMVSLTHRLCISVELCCWENTMAQKLDQYARTGAKGTRTLEDEIRPQGSLRLKCRRRGETPERGCWNIKLFFFCFSCLLNLCLLIKTWDYRQWCVSDDVYRGSGKIKRARKTECRTFPLMKAFLFFQIILQPQFNSLVIYYKIFYFITAWIVTSVPCKYHDSWFQRSI